MSSSPFAVKKFKIAFSMIWLILLADHIFLLYWLGLSWKFAIIEALVNETHLLLSCLLIMTLLRFYIPQRKNFINLVVWCFSLNIIGLFLTRWALRNFLGSHTEYMDFLNDSMIVRGSINFLIIGIVALISIIWYNQQDMKAQEERKQAAEKMSKEAELFKLRQQLQPHFLFNSLNSINALIGSRPELARKMVHQLSDFLRGTLKKDERQWLQLDAELEHLRLYLEIEKVRFGNRLITRIHIEKETENMKLPAMLLQPIMENAIKFGLYDTIGEIEIRLEAYHSDKTLIIEIINPFDPETAGSSHGTGFGLDSVKRRLYLLFGRTDLLTTRTHNNQFTTTIKIPQL